MYRIRIVLLVLSLLPILVGLGFWQLDRYHSKQAMEQQFQARRSGQFSISDLKGLDDPVYYPLSLTGRFDNEHSFLLDNRTYEGQVGFHVLTPFSTASGESVIVDRGWIAGTPDRRRLPSVPVADGLVTIAGKSWEPAGEAFLLAEDVWSDKWPKVIQAIDRKRMAATLNIITQPWLLVQDSDQPGSLQRNFHLTNMPATRHYGYAIQWFSLAAVLVLLGLWAVMKDKKNKLNAVTAVTKEEQL